MVVGAGAARRIRTALGSLCQHDGQVSAVSDISLVMHHLWLNQKFLESLWRTKQMTVGRLIAFSYVDSTARKEGTVT